jgi:hypothetical protein
MQLIVFGLSYFFAIISLNAKIYSANNLIRNDFSLAHFFSENSHLLWIIIPLLILLFGILLFSFFKIHNRFNHKQVEDYMKFESFDKEYQLYFLFIGILLPIFEIIFERSSVVSNASIGSIGPKISSTMTLLSGCGSSTIVGAMYKSFASVWPP